MNLVILGPQGSGKGTQAGMLVNKYGFTRVETGEILRKIAESDHPWGKRVKSMMLKGALVSDDILNAVLKETLNMSHPKGFLFDGTPRNFPQYKLIRDILALKGERMDKVVFINISEAETVKRLSSRQTCRVCGKVYNLVTDPSPHGDKCECGGNLVQREDDTPDAIKKRLEAFNHSTEKVIEAAKKEGVLVEINGEKPIEEIHKEIVAKLGL
jgi:adenylate kinase